MAKIAFIAFFSLLALSCSQSAAPSPARLEILDFQGDVFPAPRKLRVWLPPGYDDEPSRRYPVLYVNDGQMLFDAETSNVGRAEWGFDETAEALIDKGEIEKLIVVGVDNIGRANRGDEYLPYEDVYLTPPIPNPHGADYPAFLFDDVIPFIEQRYRADPKRRSLGGASYGGLISVYTAAARPGALEALLVESPSLYVDDAHVLTMAAGVKDWPSRVYLGVGTHEGPTECRDDNAVAEAVDDVKRLQSIIETNDPDTDISVVVEQCGMHAPAYWAKRLPGALKFLFPRK